MTDQQARKLAIKALKLWRQDLSPVANLNLKFKIESPDLDRAVEKYLEIAKAIEYFENSSCQTKKVALLQEK